MTPDKFNFILYIGFGYRDNCTNNTQKLINKRFYTLDR
jgi:hypothetical protein